MDKGKANNSTQGQRTKEDKNNTKVAWWQPAIVLFLKLSVWIVIPVLAGTYIGKWLDKKYDSEPWLFLISVGATFIISMIAIIINTLREFKKIDKNDKRNTTN